MGNPSAWRALVALAGLLLVTASACAGEKRRAVGETCSADGECASGLCLDDRCVDPSADNDADGLINSVEGTLGTSPFDDDSDGDGKLDGSEVGIVGTPSDFDGDGRIDAIESDRTDADGDCLVDQRDPDDHAVTTDPAALGQLGCCCNGHCDDGTTATCSGGQLVCSSIEFDRDRDGTADRCDPSGVVLSGDALSGACTSACHAEHLACKDAGPEADCIATCTTRGASDGLWVANDACAALTCDRTDSGTCYGAGRGFPEAEACAPICARLTRCGALGSVGASSEAACRALCTGVMHADPDSNPGKFMTCAGSITLPDGACHSADFLPCVVGDAICQSACTRFGADSKCAREAPAFDTWPNAEACVAECAARSGFGQTAFLGCVGMGECAAPPAACHEDPTTVAPSGCTAFCAKFVEVCTSPPWNDPSLCEGLCTGLGQLAPWIDPGTSAAIGCLAKQTCPTTGQGAEAGLIVGCALQPSNACDNLCTRIEACGIRTPVDCRTGCTGVTLNHPEAFASTIACADATTANDCKGLTACLPALPNAVCPAACAHLVKCEPNFPGGLAACTTECSQALSRAPAEHYARWACEAAGRDCNAACAAIETGSAGVPAECASACATSDACIEVDYGLCGPACAGIMRADGPSSDPACILANLGRRCAVSTLSCVPR